MALTNDDDDEMGEIDTSLFDTEPTSRPGEWVGITYTNIEGVASAGIEGGASADIEGEANAAVKQ